MPYSLHQQVKLNTMLSRHELLIAKAHTTPLLYIRTKDIEPFFMQAHTTLDAKEQKQVAEFLHNSKQYSAAQQRIIQRIRNIYAHYGLPIELPRYTIKNTPARVLISCGPMASGKTYTGKHLATLLGYTYIESDVFHRQSSVDKMKASIPLTDQERADYIESLQQAILYFTSKNQSVVIAFPAHSIEVRAQLRALYSNTTFIRFSATAQEIRTRCAKRNHPYIPKQCEELIATQLKINTPLTAKEIAQGDIAVPETPAMKPGQLFNWLLERLR